MNSGQTFRKVLSCVILVLVMALAIFNFYYDFKYDKELIPSIPSVIKRMIGSPRQTPAVTEAIPSKLTVNPEYDGTSREYIYSSASDDNAVVMIHQSISYRYYDNDGNGIETVHTHSYDAAGEVLFSGYRRDSCKMPDASVTRKEIDIVYSYDDDIIHREITTASYTDAGKTVETSSSEQNRNQILEQNH